MVFAFLDRKQIIKPMLKSMTSLDVYVWIRMKIVTAMFKHAWTRKRIGKAMLQHALCHKQTSELSISACLATYANHQSHAQTRAEHKQISKLLLNAGACNHTQERFEAAIM